MPKRTRSYDSWLLEELTDPVIASSYINAASEDSEEMLLLAMRNVAEAHKMARVAQGANVSRESLYKTLSSEGNPRLGNFRSILDVFGLKVCVTPKHTVHKTLEAEPDSDVSTNCSTGNTFKTGMTSTAQAIKYFVFKTTVSESTVRLSPQPTPLWLVNKETEVLTRI